MNIPNPLAGGETAFDAYDEFVPEHLPEPGAFLADHDVLAGTEHAALHRLARELFEERGVYDVTFGYNLARLNLDPRHEDAGFRYAVEADDSATLRAEFTPTTPFCPQARSLALGAFRAFNGLADRHEFEAVRVRVDEMHHSSDAINAALSERDAIHDEGSDVDVEDLDGVPATDRAEPVAGASDDERAEEEPAERPPGGFDAPF